MPFQPHATNCGRELYRQRFGEPLGWSMWGVNGRITNRGYLAGQGIKVTIPERSDQIAGRARRGSNGGRPRSIDKEAYKGRNVVEHCFNRLKQWRGNATRSDKTARSYLTDVTLASVLTWIKSGL